MTLSSIQLRQMISARVSSTGLQKNIKVGGSNSVSLTSTEADIIYDFTLTSGNTGNSVDWHLDTSELELSGSSGTEGTNLISSNPVGASGAAERIIDAAGAEVSNTVAKIIAIYYETDANNDGDVTITTAGANAVKLGGTFTLDGEVGVARSALLVPRFDTSSDNKVTFTWTATTDIIRVVCIAKD